MMRRLTTRLPISDCRLPIEGLSNRKSQIANRNGGGFSLRGTRGLPISDCRLPIERLSNRKSQIANRNGGGFSLVEMLAALTIFSVGVVSTLEVFTLCLHSAGTSLNCSRAALLAQGLVEEVMAEDSHLDDEEDGEFGYAFPDATWTREILETETSGLYEVTVTVTWPERGKERTFELTTLVADR